MMFKPMLPVAILIAASAFAVVATVFVAVSKRYRNKNNFIRLGIIALTIMSLFRPMIPFNGKASVASSNTVIYFVVDSTGSMATEDESGKARIVAARSDMSKIIDGFVAPKVGVFVQDVITYQSLPITSDVGAAKQLVSTILVKDVASSEGTDINKLLKSASEHSKRYKKRNPDAAIAVFILSDGEDGEKDELDADDGLQKSDFEHVSYGAVIGYGSREGGKVPNIKIKSGLLDYAQDSTDPYLKRDGKYVISAKNEELLRRISNTYGFKYGGTNDIDAMIAEANEKVAKPTVTDDEVDVNSAFELYWIIMLLIGILLLIEFSKDFNNLLAEREVKK